MVMEVGWMFDERVIEMLNLLDEGISVIDTNGKIVFCNKKAALLDNIDIETATGRHILEVYPSLSDKTSTLLNVLNTGQEIHDNLQTFQNYKGEKITTINTSIAMRKSKKIIGALEISRDITQVRKLTEEVVDLKNELIHSKSYNDVNISNKGTVVKNPRDKQLANKIKGYTFMDIIGQNSEILMLKAYALKAAGASSPVLIYGETGTGKELFVQSIHNSSSRKNKPFIAQNCAALPSTLLEGILFGTVKGSFTGAEDRPGLFELADGGTLYLDELNSTPLDLQAKLLRVLQDGVIRRVGDVNERLVDVRIIVSTNVDPEQCVAEGIIRKDLYYRINVISLKIPELKFRKSDIPILVEHFITKYNQKLNLKLKGITRPAMEKIISYDWPGNVRELQHIIEGLMNMKESEYIEYEDLPEYIKNNENKSIFEILEENEKGIILDAMKLWKNNISKTADYLSIPRQTLQYKIKKFRIK
ncbi:MAG: modulated sigma54 specific transcriptional regulator, Fis family [Clostridiales bacterium]|jgi:arginine utilization regulatory protein|nr:modulated sigma54 specific transcriptional regulator, Fis family [Clostridiales bacterium]